MCRSCSLRVSWPERWAWLGLPPRQRRSPSSPPPSARWILDTSYLLGYLFTYLRRCPPPTAWPPMTFWSPRPARPGPRTSATPRWAVIGGELVTWPRAHLWLVHQTIETEEIEYEPLCKDVVDVLCDAPPAPAPFFGKREATAEAEADPQFPLGPPAHAVATRWPHVMHREGD